MRPATIMLKLNCCTVFLASVLLILMSGCQKAPDKPKISEIFKTQLVEYLKDAGKLSTQSGEGINVLTLRSQLTDAKATFDLLNSTWPSDFAPEAKESFKKSHEGYDLVLELWRLKLNKSDEPTSPDINGWSSFQNSTASQALVVRTHGGDYIVEDYRGKKYLPFDENIAALLGYAGSQFEEGRASVLKVLE